MAQVTKEKCLQEDREMDDIVSSEDDGTSALQYRIDESPPFHITLFISLQHLMIAFASTLTLTSIIGDVLCAKTDDPLRSKLFSTALCMSGLNTILQSILGSRLPVFQGPSFTFITPLIALGTDPSWSCSSGSDDTDTLISNANMTNIAGLEKLTATEKLQQMSGSLMAASAIEVVIGGLGLVGPLMRFAGPITVAPIITLIGLSLYRIPVDYSRPCPPMAAASALLVLLFSLYLQRIMIPIGCGKRKTRLPIFQVLPVLLSIGLTWTVAAILTTCGVFTDDPASLGYKARTDAKAGIVNATPWLLATYPGQFGMPSFNVAAFVGFSAAVLSSVIESVGDYLAAARSCDVPIPPQHAVSRGIMMEGLGSVLGGGYGAAHATSTYSGNIALLSLCRTASRSVLVTAGIILIAVSFVGKVAAAFSTVPEPILGGIFLVILGILVALGIATLKHTDLHSTRNLIIIGVSIFVGLAIPDWIARFPDCIDTGDIQADQALRVTLGTPMILGGIVGCFLDNTVPGTIRERGLHEWTAARLTKADSSDSLESAILEQAQLEQKTYGWRRFVGLRRKCRLFRLLPFLPPYGTMVQSWSSCTREEMIDT
ncbi:solute carrier family 23 member 1-like [Littorina saxatilis]|uniref:Solute carrier family 23 member 2 n=1 Tax=Littorina saxatilis TaxID=31220 RepID=A0AAN9BS02_9CAEN